MLVYDFIFTAADYSGTTAHIYGMGGAEVAESPVTLDVTGRFSLSLAEGIYYAVTSSPRRGLNNAQAQGVLNMPASIAAGGGGAILDGPSYLCEILEGYAPPGTVIWDSIDEGLTPGASPGFINLPAGLWLASLEFDFDEPDAAWAIGTTLNGREGLPSFGQNMLNPWGDYGARVILGQVIFPLAEAMDIYVSLTAAPDPDAVEPTALNVSYGSWRLTKIG